MQQIGNVFYNLLGMIGHKNGDTKLIGIGNTLRDNIQSQKFHNLFDKGNVPYAGYDKINLLRTMDMSNADQAMLMNKGLGDLLHHPTAQLMSTGMAKRQLEQRGAIDMDLEAKTPFKRSVITLTFVAYKTPTHAIEQSKLPKALEFRFRFFTFSEVKTAPLKLITSTNFGTGKTVLAPGTAYQLQKQDRYMANVEFERGGNPMEQLFRKAFDIDPSLSGIKDEHVKLAEYLKDRYLTIECFDS